MPPDKMQGLWRDVFVTSSGALRMHDPFVRSRLATNLASADLIVSMDLENTSDKPVTGSVAVTLDGVVTKIPVSVAGGATQKVSLDGSRTPRPAPHEAAIVVAGRFRRPGDVQPAGGRVRGNTVSDESNIRFGVREVTSEMTADGYRLYSSITVPSSSAGRVGHATFSSWRPQSAKSRRCASSTTWG